jgi:outer membrane protein TolC
VLKLVQTRFDAGSATALELAQQKKPGRRPATPMPRVQQQAQDALITLAALLGRPVQQLLGDKVLRSPAMARYRRRRPSELLTQRPDIARAEATGRRRS